MHEIFINYRTHNSRLAAKVVEEEVVGRFGRQRVFLDTSSIGLGEHFNKKIIKTVAEAKVLLVLMDSQWLVAKNSSGGNIHSEDDWVRQEIALALGNDVPIIPLLLDNATWPKPAELPESIRAIHNIQALVVRSGSFKDDLAKVLDTVEDRRYVIVPNPYVGVRPFQEAQKDYFFGRDKKQKELRDLVKSNRLIVVTGGQGSGKSSLVNVTLLSEWPTKWVLRPAPGERPASVVDGIPRGEKNDDQLVFVDQFEEYVADSVVAGRQLLELLIARTRQSPVRVVVTMRSGDLERVLTSAMVDSVTQLDLRPMNGDELLAAIIKPARKAGGFEFEEGLPEKIVQDAGGTPGQLPLIGFALSEMWAAKRKLTFATYQRIGGLTGALDKHAEAILKKVGDEEGEDGKKLVRRLLIRLARDGDNGGYDMRPVRLDELEPALQRMARKLSGWRDDRHRLVEIRSQPGQPDMVALIHISLATAWQRLKGWLEADCDFRNWEIEIEKIIEGNAKLGRHGLHAAKEWRRRRGADLSPRIDSYIRMISGQRRRLAAGLAVLLVIALVGGVAALVAVKTAFDLRDVEGSGAIAERAASIRLDDPARSAQLSLAAYRLINTPTARSQLLSTFASEYATKLDDHTDAVESIAVRRGGAVLATGSKDGNVVLWNTANPHRPIRLRRLDVGPAVWSVAISQDGTLLAAGAADHTVRLWDIGDPRRPASLPTLTGHTHEVQSIAFGQNDVLASVDHSGFVHLWDVTRHDSPIALRTWRGHTERVWSLAISPDGRTLATASWDHSVRLWDITNPRAPSTLPTTILHNAKAFAVAFTPDGHTLATGDEDDVRLWNISNRHPPVLLHTLASTNTVSALAFSADGRTLSAARWDNNVGLWDTTDPRRPTNRAEYRGHSRQVTSVAFTPDGNTLITGSSDQTTRLWDLPEPAHWAHTEGILHASVNRRGGLMATGGGRDHTAALWDVADPARPERLATIDTHEDNVDAVLFHPTKEILATASFDGTVRLWDVAAPRKPRSRATLHSGHKTGITTAAFSTDGTTLVTGSYDRTVRVWDLRNLDKPAMLASLDPHSNRVTMLAVGRGPAGIELLSVVDVTGTATMWDITNPYQPKQLSTFPAHEDESWAVAMSPDGRTLATGGRDNVFRLWDITDPRLPMRLGEYKYPARGEVGSLSFSVDGATLAAGKNSGTIDLWNIRNPHAPEHWAALNGHTNSVAATLFHPDRHTLISASADQRIRVWETDPERVAKHICEIAYPPITPEDWQEDLPDRWFVAPCEPET